MGPESEIGKASEVARLLTLVETERRYWQDLVASAPVPLAVVDPDLTLVLVNRSFRARFRLGAADLGSARITELITTSDLEARIRDVFASGKPQAGFRQEIHEGGLSKPAKVSLVPVRSWQEGAEPEVLLAVEDYAVLPAERPAAPSPRSIVSAVAAAVAAANPSAAAAEGRLPEYGGAPVVTGPARRTADYLEAVVWEMDPETLRFTSVSARAGDISGVAREDWRTPAEMSQTIVHPDDREQYLEFYSADFSRRETAALEYRTAAEGGPVRWLRDIVRYLPREGGKPARLVGITLDATLQQAEERMSREDGKREAVERLAARVAHVANNMLMIVAGYADDLIGTFAPADPRRGDVEEIQRSAQRLARLSAQLNAIAQPSRYDAAPLDLNEWAAAATPKLRSAWTGLAPVELRRASQGLWARANTQVLDQILHEAARLLRPVLGARSSAGLSLEPGRDGATAEVTLTLTGVTLEPGLRERFFEPFAGPKAQGQDPPVGLAAWMKPLRAMGGLALLEGEPGEDVRFVLRLARAEAPARIRRPAEPAVPSGRCILLVEDEAAIRSVIKRGLEREGYQVLTVPTTEEGFDWLQRRDTQIHLLITDIQVPRKNGMELARQAAALRPGLPILLISGESGDVRVDPRALPPGAAFLAKPFSVQTLAEQVNEMLHGRAAGA
jgi:CheY-like chemotaxis protein